MHNINNTISSNTMKYCIITRNIVSTDTFLYLCSTIIYSLQDLSTYFVHSKLFILIQIVFVPPFSTYPTWYIEPKHAEVASTHLYQPSTSTARHSVGAGAKSWNQTSPTTDSHCHLELLRPDGRLRIMSRRLFLPLNSLLHWSQRLVSLSGYRARLRNFA